MDRDSWLQESIPVSFLVPDWASGHVASAVMEILVREVMGYEVGVPGFANSVIQAIYGLLGCAGWDYNYNYPPNCETRKIQHHVFVESLQHHSPYLPLVNELSNIFQEEMPEDAGDVGCLDVFFELFHAMGLF